LVDLSKVSGISEKVEVLQRSYGFPYHRGLDLVEQIVRYGSMDPGCPYRIVLLLQILGFFSEQVLFEILQLDFQKTSK